ncbi:glycosyltransferase, partial [archaeon]
MSLGSVRARRGAPELAPLLPTHHIRGNPYSKEGKEGRSHFQALSSPCKVAIVLVLCMVVGGGVQCAAGRLAVRSARLVLTAARAACRLPRDAGCPHPSSRRTEPLAPQIILRRQPSQRRMGMLSPHALERACLFVEASSRRRVRLVCAGCSAQAAFPSLMHDDASVTLSVIVPAYNEEERMPEAMEEMFAHLRIMESNIPYVQGRRRPRAPAVATRCCLSACTRQAERSLAHCSDFSWELIIVDDGSKDATATVAQAMVSEHGDDAVRLLRLYHNSGKGAAVRKGMMRARGEYLLMADADGATQASDTTLLL